MNEREFNEGTWPRKHLQASNFTSILDLNHFIQEKKTAEAVD